MLPDRVFGKEVFIRLTVRVFREHLSICLSSSFPFGIEGGMWDLIVLISDSHFIAFLFTLVPRV